MIYCILSSYFHYFVSSIKQKMTEHIDKIIYINLDKREDRYKEINEELERMDLVNISERFSAIEVLPPMGILGCGKSHLAVLKLAKERGYKHVLILEDDFQFLVDCQEFRARLTRLFQEHPQFDVCFLTCALDEGHIIEETPFLSKVVFASTASAYIVQAHYLDALIGLYEWAMPELENTCAHWIYANDQVWRDLQKQDHWICFTDRLGQQRPGFSDNTQRFVDRGV